MINKNMQVQWPGGVELFQLEFFMQDLYFTAGRIHSQWVLVFIIFQDQTRSGIRIRLLKVYFDLERISNQDEILHRYGFHSQRFKAFYTDDAQLT